MSSFVATSVPLRTCGRNIALKTPLGDAFRGPCNSRLGFDVVAAEAFGVPGPCLAPFGRRWRLVRAALPHVMHCCAALLHARKESCLEKLGSAETKLLYTLHWILLDAAEECSDAEHAGGPDPARYVFPISVIQVPSLDQLTNSPNLRIPQTPNFTKLPISPNSQIYPIHDLTKTHELTDLINSLNS